MNPATSSDSASTRSKGGRFGLGERRNEKDHEHRKQRQPIPAQKSKPRVLRRDDVAEIERAGAKQHGDDDEADRDFIGDHLRR